MASLVDNLLARPQFGERMAIHWLDLVRYGDSNGYHADLEWSVFPYRDYVIRAFNENQPFDDFTREQIAGDLLPNATLQQKVGSSFNRLNMKSTEADSGRRVPSQVRRRPRAHHLHYLARLHAWLRRVSRSQV